MKSILRPLIETLIRPLSGGLGRRLRYYYYRSRLGSCGKGLIIDEGVYFTRPELIHLSENVWIDKNCVLIAGPNTHSDTTKAIENNSFSKKKGEIHIGRNAHIGMGSILQGHGGIEIEDYFTSSAGCKIYTLSNDPFLCHKGTYGEKDIFYISSPVKIEKNVWMALNCIMIGNTIGANSFIHANSIISKTIEQNSIAQGAPAVKIKKRFYEKK